MTNEQAKKMLKAKLECLKRETSGTDFDCNRCNCDECSLNYEQGNMGEQKEALDIGIKALEQQPKRGEWIKEDTEQGALGIQYTIKRCSKCGWTHGLLIPKDYCPNCGSYNGGGKE